jgi:FdhD protein
MSNTLVTSQHIFRFNNNEYEPATDLLAVEEPLEIRIGYGMQQNRNQKSIAVTMRTPGHDFELALGFLFTEGIISGKDDILNIRYCFDPKATEKNENIVRVELKPNIQIDFEKLNRHFYTTSSCGVCGKSSIQSVMVNCKPVSSNNFNIYSKLIVELPGILRKSQPVFEHTGGLHASALFDENGKLLLLREDVGRHNALDKLIGAILGLNLKTQHTVLLLSGRASFELLQKAAVAQIPVVCAIGAPSSLAVQMAENTGITLIGFLRNNRFNVYTHQQRIVVS